MKRLYEQKWLTNTDMQKAQAIRVIRELPAGYMVHVKPAESKRSLAQNNLMWALIRQVSAETGADVDCVKEELQRMFLGCVQYEWQGEVRERLIGTSELKVGEMHQFIERVMCWMTLELGLEVDFRELDRTAEVGQAA